MKKEIYFRMTTQAALQYGFPIPNVDAFSRSVLRLRPLEVDTEELSPVARWLAENITSTYITDDYLHKCTIVAIAGFTQKERDEKNGTISKERIENFCTYYPEYARDPMHELISFPILGWRLPTPKAVLEETARQLIDIGAVKLISRDFGTELDIPAALGKEEPHHAD